MTLLDIRDMHLTITDNAFHYHADNSDNELDQYIVWAEDGQAKSEFANDIMDIQVITGTTDYFTKEEFDPNFNLIQKAFNDFNLSWELNSIQYEEDTKYIHYEWVWEVDNQIG